MPIKPIHAASPAPQSASPSFTSQPLEWVVDSIQQIGSFSFIGSIASGCFSEKGRNTLIQYSLIGATCLGTVGSVVILISGLPAVSALTAALSAATATGAWMAQQAADQWALKQSLEEQQRQTEAYAKENQIHCKENKVQRKHNKTYKKENIRLKSNLNHLTEQVNRAEQNNEEHQRQLGELRGEVSTHKANNAHQEQQIDRLVANSKEEMMRIEELRQRNLELLIQVGQLSHLAEDFKANLGQMKTGNKKHDAAITEQVNALAVQIGSAKALWENYRDLLQGNFSQLEGILEKTTGTWLQEQGVVMRIIKESEEHLEVIRAQDRELSQHVAAMHGEMKFLKEEHAGILVKHRELNDTQGDNNRKFGEGLEMLSELGAAVVTALPSSPAKAQVVSRYFLSEITA